MEAQIAVTITFHIMLSQIGRKVHLKSDLRKVSYVLRRQETGEVGGADFGDIISQIASLMVFPPQSRTAPSASHLCTDQEIRPGMRTAQLLLSQCGFFTLALC